MPSKTLNDSDYRDAFQDPPQFRLQRRLPRPSTVQIIEMPSKTLHDSDYRDAFQDSSTIQIIEMSSKTLHDSDYRDAFLRPSTSSDYRDASSRPTTVQITEMLSQDLPHFTVSYHKHWPLCDIYTTANNGKCLQVSVQRLLMSTWQPPQPFLNTATTRIMALWCQ